MTESNITDRHDAWDQIPWLINGTLNAADQAAVEAHIATCAECSAEFDRQQRLNEVIATLDAPVPNQAQALESIAHRLTTQKSARGASGQIVDLISRLFTPTRVALGGALAAMLVVAFVSFPLFEPRYETLTSPAASADGVEIRLRYQADVDPKVIRGLMADAGALNVTGPSETGLMKGIVKPDDAEAVLDQLRSDPRIVFVGKDQ